MIYQNANGNKKPIKDEGCYFVTLAKIYKTLAEKKITSKDLNFIYDQGIKYKAMRSDCYILSGGVQMLFLLLSDHFKKPVGGVFLFKEKLDGTRYEIANDYLLPTHWIGRFSNVLNGKPYSHFVEMEKPKKVIYDPWYPGSKAVEYGILEDYRAIHAEVL